MTKIVVFYVDNDSPVSASVDNFMFEQDAINAAKARGLDYYYRHEQHFIDEMLVHASWERVNV